MTTTATGFTTAFAEADPARRDLLGGKGAGLAEMVQAGLRVPPGFVVSTAACAAFLERGALPEGLLAEVLDHLRAVEAATGAVFGPVDGDERPPLLLSVRSGAPVSMPGMMDTILNLGLTPQAAATMAQASGDVRFVGDLVARFHRMYADTVLGEDPEHDDVDVHVASLPAGPGDGGAVYGDVWQQCAAALAEETDELVPVDPAEQLVGAVEAVFRSWNTRRARTYRDFHGISHDMGTAVVIQAMVFGNLSDDSGSGVCFTRNPVTGEPGLYGEFLARAQGEDVVAGTRTPTPIEVARAELTQVFAELEATAAQLERNRGDVLDIEFTVERSTLYLLQVRSAKRTPEAAVRIAVDLLHEGLADPRRALGMVTPEQLRQVQRPGFDGAEVVVARDGGRLLTTGTGACAGQVCGVLVLDPDRAKQAAAEGHPVILARAITSPTDLHGMIAARGIITATGGSTSHAAVVARALGRPCVVGAGELVVDERARTVTLRGAGSEDGRVLAEGEIVSLDGSTGELFAGAFTTSSPAAAHR
ncbi:MAG: pyruvate, phosphate dikinase, partial [Janthinobacterium lividum]